MDPFAFEIFGFGIRWYGIIIAISLIAGFIAVYYIARYRKVGFYKNRPGRLPNGLMLSIYLGIYAVYWTFIEYYRIDSTYFGPVKVVYLINLSALIAALIIANYVIRKFREKKLKVVLDSQIDN